jgi:hypothetical protein
MVRISELNPLCDPLSFPLRFPNGGFGWSIDSPPSHAKSAVTLAAYVVAVLTDRAHSAELTVFLGAVELQAVLCLDRRELLRTLSDPSEFAGWMNVLIQR